MPLPNAFAQLLVLGRLLAFARIVAVNKPVEVFPRLALLRTHPYNSVPLRTGRISSVSEVLTCSGIVAVNLPMERLLALVRLRGGKR